MRMRRKTLQRGKILQPHDKKGRMVMGVKVLEGRKRENDKEEEIERELPMRKIIEMKRALDACLNS